MRRVVFVALLAAAVAVVLWRCREQADVATPSPRTLPVPPVPPVPPRAPPHHPPALDVDAKPPPVLGQAIPEALVQRLTAAHDAVLVAVDPCWDDPGPPKTPAGAPDATVQRFRVRYRLVVEGGQARAVEVEPIDSTISDPRMDQCLLDRMRAARWSSPGADVTTPVNDVIILGEIVQRRGPTGPM
jgi:hypothetical protein